ncbi:PREDICTED: uncharacterized protein LOC104701927 [Camelina sativa]|uniref:Uncharacterized protein LOC104701927 n=1 Tax=Camelina sativa TaxID=90675 RepID=A0ABM0STQ6_CAMSA|nr:PREDICTED: uncharacterized protein LOC104701927 [Camelina sativa]
MYVGRNFETKDEFKIVLFIHAINQVFRFRFVRYKKCYLVAQCVDKLCDWRVYAHQIGDSEEYEVRKVKLEHICDVETRGQFTKHATSKVMSALLRSKYVNVLGGPRARDLPEVVLGEHNVTASYWKCWKARELAVASAQGTEESSYLLLPLYLHLLQVANPGTVYHLLIEDDEVGEERFKFAFVALGASIQGLKYIRRVVVINRTHLHGKYNGCLLTASGQDANFQVFPIAFAIVDSENHDSWTWFMEKLKDIVHDGTDLTIISDRHQSIYHAKSLVYPRAHHGCCLVHLKCNIRSLYSRTVGLVWKAGEAFRVKDFNKWYGRIKKRKPQCWKYLQKIGVAHWPRAHFKGERYNLLTNNIAESLNHALLPARDSPIVALIEFFRKMLSRWFESRRKKVTNCRGYISVEVEKFLKKQLKESIGVQVRLASAWDCEITAKDGQKFHVSLEKRTCTCRAFQLLQIPCSHAMAAAKARGLEYQSLVGHMHKKDTWRPTFDGVILPLQDPSEVNVPECIMIRYILPPETKRPPGRPPKTRIPSTGEFEKSKTSSKQNRCGRCNGLGHNRVRCSVPLR